MRKLLTLGAMCLLLTSCGKDKVDGEQTVRVITETITCDKPNICANDRLVCRKLGYYGERWECTLVLEREVGD